MKAVDLLLGYIYSYPAMFGDSNINIVADRLQAPIFAQIGEGWEPSRGVEDLLRAELEEAE